MTSMTDRISEHRIQYCQTWNMPFFVSRVIFFRNPIGLIFVWSWHPLGVALKRSKLRESGLVMSSGLYYPIFLGDSKDSNKPMGWIHGIPVMKGARSSQFSSLDLLSFVTSAWVKNSQDAVNMLPVSGDMVEVDDALQATRHGKRFCRCWL